ncbi:MAG TPA: hypothetical protein VK154_01220 [Chitinophagales bacterium]|nr:hypothetical protein [Chitinophagales bacterium]
MKKGLYTLAAIMLLAVSTQTSQAQAWDKSTKVLALGLGGSNFAHVYTNANYWNGWNAPLTGQFNFQGEFGIHDYVGLGFTTGVGGRAGYYWGYGFGRYGSNGELTVPIGFVANFHFFQLIADKTGKDIHSDKLDVYAGIDVGGGIAAQFFDNSNQIVPIAFGGVHAGVRYYFTDRFGVNGEIGTPYSKGFVNGGIVFKL